MRASSSWSHVKLEVTNVIIIQMLEFLLETPKMESSTHRAIPIDEKPTSQLYNLFINVTAALISTWSTVT